MNARLLRRLGSLRTRVYAAFVVAILLAGMGFHVTLVSVTRARLARELDYRSRSLATMLAERAVTPLVLGDRLELQDEVARLARETDVVGAGIYGRDGALLAVATAEPRLWPGGPWSPPPAGVAGAGEASSLSPSQEAGIEVRVIAVPVLRAARRASSPEEEAGEVFGLSAPAAPGAALTGPVGWVRIATSTRRLEKSVASASRVGTLVLLIALGLALLGTAFLVRFLVRPLREAGELAREIAAGNLERRLPVRTDDELGTLAGSMNAMAEALTEARLRAEDEAEALRTAAEAVVAIAQGARATREPRVVFEVVAAQARRVTGAEGIALALPEPESGDLRFGHFEPGLPWGGLREGDILEADWLRRFVVGEAVPIRVRLPGSPGGLFQGLASDGFRVALLVPLPLTQGLPAVLLLVSCRDEAFAPAEVDVVGALASHLSSALHAARLTERLELAFGELERTRDHLVRSEKLRVAGEMAAGAAHDFNNVLGAILGRAQLLLRQIRADKMDAAAFTASLEVIQRAAQDGSETVRRLRRFGQGEGVGTPVEVDLDRVLRDAAEYTRTGWEDAAQASGRPIELMIESASGAWVLGRPTELREVFTNLLLNSIDALPLGGTIRIHTAPNDEEIAIVLEDSGTGMSEETRRRIFDPFFTTKGERGTGLGMSIVYGIVRRHGGQISVESEPGRGARVALSFPRAVPGRRALPILEEPGRPGTFATGAGEERTGADGDDVGERAAEHGVEGASYGPDGAEVTPLRVLVVDDEPAVRDLLADILRALGHDATACASGPEALARYAPRRFDLVVSDLGMPGMSGWQFAEAIRTRDPDVPIAFVTGWGEQIDPAAVRRAGADALVAKPFTIEDVARLTHMAARRRGREAA